MNALDNRSEDENDPKIALGTADRETYYLLEGEEYLREFLLIDGNFPRPVGCIKFKSMVTMAAFLGEDVNIMELWQINSAIVDRLRNDNDLLEVDAPDA